MPEPIGDERLARLQRDVEMGLLNDGLPRTHQHAQDVQALLEEVKMLRAEKTGKRRWEYRTANHVTITAQVMGSDSRPWYTLRLQNVDNETFLAGRHVDALREFFTHRLTEDEMAERITSALTEDPCWQKPNDFDFDGAARHILAMIREMVANDIPAKEEAELAIRCPECTTVFHVKPSKAKLAAMKINHHIEKEHASSNVRVVSSAEDD